MQDKESHGKPIEELVTVFQTHLENSWGQADPKRAELARKEGEVIWYSNLALDRGNAIAQGFMKLHPP